MKHKKLTNNDLSYALDEKTVVPHTVHGTRNLLTSESYIFLCFIISIRMHLKSVYFSVYVNIFSVYNGWTLIFVYRLVF